MIILELGKDKKNNNFGNPKEQKMIIVLKQMMFFDNFEEAKMIKT